MSSETQLSSNAAVDTPEFIYLEGQSTSTDNGPKGLRDRLLSLEVDEALASFFRVYGVDKKNSLPPVDPPSPIITSPDPSDLMRAFVF